MDFGKKQTKKTGGTQMAKQRKKHSKKKRVGKGFNTTGFKTLQPYLKNPFSFPPGRRPVPLWAGGRTCQQNNERRSENP